MKSNEIFINGKKWRLDPRQAIGKGGEADVYDIGKGQALKLFKTPEHPDFALDSLARQTAAQRLAEHQTKLRQFPANLPASVISPQEFATDATGQNIVGYTMPLLRDAEVLLRYGERTFRENSGIDSNRVVEIFRDLHATLKAIHHSSVVIGDFNDLNVLIRHGETRAFVIDADSFQFAPFLCHVFTARFLDPILVDTNAQSMAPDQPQNALSDWYAFCVMLIQCLLYVEPYGGIYKPKDATKKVAHHLRPLQRITVFHDEVRYPKPALPLEVLPDDLLQFFEQVFVQDRREAFPVTLLESLRWTKCAACGHQYARALCPFCYVAPAIIKQSIAVRGNVTATRIFQTEGTILCALFDGELRYLLHENGKFKRENGTVILQGNLDAQTRFCLHGAATIIGRQDQIIVLQSDQTERISTDKYETQPVFASNENHIYWTQNGQLWRDASLGSQFIGDVLMNQTQFWCGPKFGFGFYRAGNLSVAFTFDAEKSGLNDNVDLPPLNGQLLNASCAFSEDLCWLFVALQEKGQLLHRCFVVRSNGAHEASAIALQGDGSWLGGPLAGKCAIGNFVLAPTDDGIVSVETIGGQLSVTKTFPNTEPFVRSGNQLFPGNDGLYVAGKNEIHVLKIR